MVSDKNLSFAIGGLAITAYLVQRRGDRDGDNGGDGDNGNGDDGNGDNGGGDPEPDWDVAETFDDAGWDGTFGDGWDYGLDANASLVSTASMPGSQLQATVPGGENRGIYTIHNHRQRAGTAPVKCYQRYSIRFVPGFMDAATDDGKLPGFAGRDGTDEGAGGTPAQGTGWSARMGWDDPGDHSGPGVPVDYYVYHMDAPGSYGEHEVWNDQLAVGEWHEIEQYIDLGTPGENDGILRGWVNGSLSYERDDLRWRESGGNDVQWTWWDFYHGGGAVPNGDISVQFDNFYVLRGGSP